MNNTTVLSLADLIQRATKYLEDLNYAKGTKQHYTLKWGHLLQYAKSKRQETFSLELGYEFLESYYGIKNGMKLSTSQVLSVRTVKVLNEFMLNKKFDMCHQKEGKQVPYQFKSVLLEYILLQQEIQLSKRTIQGKRIQLINFLSFLSQQDINHIKELTPNHVLQYINLLSTYSQASKSGILFTLRDFLAFLYSNDYTCEPINKLFPVIFSNKFERIPSYFSTEEIKKILNCIDRNSVFGRRDYLVMLLAVQLGMRAGDIRNLRFSNIKWNISTIEFIQEKTKHFLQLPLLDNLKYALLDYMKNSHAQLDCEHLFIRMKAPFICYTSTHSFFYIINKYMRLAGINIDNRKHGLHSMRHSLAANLLNQNTPLPVITGVLGHENSNTTKLYLRIDIEQLRSVSLEVPYEG